MQLRVWPRLGLAYDVRTGTEVNGASQGPLRFCDCLGWDRSLVATGKRDIGYRLLRGVVGLVPIGIIRLTVTSKIREVPCSCDVETSYHALTCMAPF